MESDWTNAFLLEMKVADCISRQAKHGTNFNVRRAQWYIHVLTEMIVNVDKDLIPLLPKMLNKGTEYKKPFKLNGDFMKWPGEYCASQGLTRKDVGGPFTAVFYTPFDPSKSARVKSLMLDMGWVPTTWNIKKSPFQVWRFRKKLMKMSYQKFITSMNKDEAEEIEFHVNEFLQKHFVDKSRNYMKAVLSFFNFDVDGKAPTFGEIKKRLLLAQYWPSSAKITEDSFDALSEEDSRTLTLLKKRMMISHRRSFLQGLVEQVRPDGKLSGEANSCATPTARMRHRIIVNVPAAGAFFGKECRSLFSGNENEGSPARIIVKLKPEMVASGMFRQKPNTNVMQEWNDDKERWDDIGYCRYYLPRNHDAFIGGDGAGLELRMLTHYLISVSRRLLDDATCSGDNVAIAYYESALNSAFQYRDVLLNGDIHSHNQKLAGLPTRKAAKSFIYAFLYGAGNAKLGSLVNGTMEDGAALKERFLKECPCIPVLIEWAQDHAKQFGWVPAIDGRRLIMRRDPFSGEVMAHKALNTLLQAAGSIVMKYAGCFLDNWNKRDGLDCHQVIMMHDEYQFTCRWEHVTQLRKNIDSCVEKAGLFLKMECPLASDSMLGANWYHTH